MPEDWRLGGDLQHLEAQGWRSGCQRAAPPETTGGRKRPDWATCCDTDEWLLEHGCRGRPAVQRAAGSGVDCGRQLWSGVFGDHRGHVDEG